jgi:hypothetical protein
MAKQCDSVFRYGVMVRQGVISTSDRSCFFYTTGWNVAIPFVSQHQYSNMYLNYVLLLLMLYR